MSIQRQTLREQIETEIMERVGAGDFDMGSAINEVALSVELGVSRTPLREALISLTQQGVIDRESGKGFRWAPVSAADFAEMVQIIAALESLAVSLTAPEALAKIAPELLAQARGFTDSIGSSAELDLHDDQFHELLLSGNPNRRLAESIASMKLALRRYERLLVSSTDLIERSASEHEAIATALLAGDVPAAVAALSANWNNGTNRLIEVAEAKRPA
ncbi:GntR family transcriptional regulator [Arthrobacter sp. 35W]|uniref:GntR family transcriptional regulator n=1 Tax=Arthrobacter sp. 35W TaxID=1132441 RepID=UPI00042226D7|nr:GntR family transcriptional regulator [Arthrobacter sp. 35W]